MSPELITGSMTNIPEGHQRLAKVFTLKHTQANDLKDKIRTALSDKATIDVDERANEIVIADYNDNIRVVGELIDALDSDRPEDVAVRVISLKHVGAQDLAKEIAPLYQKMTGQASKANIDVTADDRSNALIVLSSEADFRAIQRLTDMLDTEGAQEKVMKTFQLKNADAQDVAKQLQDLGQNSSVNSRYVYYFSEQPDTASKKMSVVADKRRNAVIVQAPPAQMEGIAKMINDLDEPVAGESLAPKIYHLKYASAVDIEDVLNELFLKKQQQRSYWDYYYGDDNQSSSSQDNVGRLYGKVRITSEPYSNTIIVTANSRENLEAVEQVLHELDAPSDAGDSTLRIGLKFAKAATVANSMNILFAKSGSPPLRPTAQQNQPNNGNLQQQQQQQQNGNAQTGGFELEQQVKDDDYYPWLGGGGQSDNFRQSDSRSTSHPVSDLIDRVRFVADPRGNAVLISANVHFFPQILKLIEELDAPSDQVSIEARIVEVSSDFMHRIGVRWSPDGSQTFTPQDFDNSIIAHTGTSYTKGFGGTTFLNQSNGISSILSGLRTGSFTTSMNLDFLVQFLHETVAATVLGDPQITINDNESGRLFVGQEVPIPDNTQVSTVGSQNTTLKYKDVGVILEVTPHINSAGDVELKVHAESSTVVSGQTVLNGAVFNTRYFHTDLTAKNGQTLVLGGIIQKEVSDTLRKTPVLGDVPGVGWAFKKKDKEVNEVELMVFLRPRIVRSPDAAQALLDDVNKKAPLLKEWEQDNPKPMEDLKKK
jgi:type II secretion system protein D